MDDPAGFAAASGADPHIVAAMQEEAARRLLAAAEEHNTAAPITPLDSVCIAKHVYYEALKRAGFLPGEALYLVKAESA